MKLTFTPHTLEFKRPFGIATTTRTTTPIILTQIEHDGIVAYGEASMPPYLAENHETVMSFLKKAADIIKISRDPMKTKEILMLIDQLEPGNCCAKASVDIALHDLKGKLLNKPCYALWSLDKEKTPFTSYTIGIDSPDVILEKTKEADEYKILKVKLGSNNDREIIQTIRSVTNKPITVDANQGWPNREYALYMIEWLWDKNVLFIEQPLNKNHVKDMIWLKERSPLPLIADESIQRYSDIEKIKDGFHGINIKLMKCTGMYEAFHMINRAREMDLKILIGCMSESSCAVSAAAQLCPLADWVDLDGPLLIKNDCFNGILFSEGKIVLNERPGIGVVLKETEKS